MLQHMKRLAQDAKTGGYEAALTFGDKGAELFAEATKNNVGKRIGICMDETLIKAPIVEEAIKGGRPMQIISLTRQGFKRAQRSSMSPASLCPRPALPAERKEVFACSSRCLFPPARLRRPCCCGG